MTLDSAVAWRVWLGKYSEPVHVVMPKTGTLDDLARVATLALDERFQREVRPEHAEHDEAFWTDAVAAVEVTRVERGEDVWLSPKILLSTQL